jgi:hypothetical protein
MAPRYYEELHKEAGGAAPAECVPLAGRIAAGSPVEAVEGKDTLAFADFVGQEGTFALQVRGDSMIEDHICDGDYVLVERTSAARDGDIVVALVGESETTLKRFYRESEDTIRLQPANSEMSPILVPASQVAIQGRLCGGECASMPDVTARRNSGYVPENRLRNSFSARNQSSSGEPPWPPRSSQKAYAKRAMSSRVTSSESRT